MVVVSNFVYLARLYWMDFVLMVVLMTRAKINIIHIGCSPIQSVYNTYHTDTDKIVCAWQLCREKVNRFMERWKLKPIIGCFVIIKGLILCYVFVVYSILFATRKSIIEMVFGCFDCSWKFRWLISFEGQMKWTFFLNNFRNVESE